MRVLTLSNADIHAALSPAACEQAMAGVLAARARGDAFNPLRTVTVPPGAAGFIGLMPAYASAAAAGSAVRTPRARRSGSRPSASSPATRRAASTPTRAR